MHLSHMVIILFKIHFLSLTLNSKESGEINVLFAVIFPRAWRYAKICWLNKCAKGRLYSFASKLYRVARELNYYIFKYAKCNACLIQKSYLVLPKNSSDSINNINSFTHMYLWLPQGKCITPSTIMYFKLTFWGEVQSLNSLNRTEVLWPTICLTSRQVIFLTLDSQHTQWDIPFYLYGNQTLPEYPLKLLKSG